ncbi:uncharacterized protein [Palaemon carinicauda]|uniref:uncharacterized protein n=1 Tax=Palaemon carinicauda TaxID=392227 RepID=UPI0035B6879B
MVSQKENCGGGTEVQESVNRKSKAFKDWKVRQGQGAGELYREEEKDSRRKVGIAIERAVEQLNERRWREYYEQLLNTENEKEELGEAQKEEGPVMEIRNTEVKQALRKMNGKAPGPSDFQIEKVKILAIEGEEWMLDLLRAIWEDEIMPENWEERLMVSILKHNGDIMRIPREVMFWCLEEREVPEKLVKGVKIIYKRTRSTVMEKQKHLKLVLDYTREDLVITAENEEELQRRVEEWQETLERGGLMVNVNKTEAMVSSKEAFQSLVFLSIESETLMAMNFENVIHEFAISKTRKLIC